LDPLPLDEQSGEVAAGRFGEAMPEAAVTRAGTPEPSESFGKMLKFSSVADSPDCLFLRSMRVPERPHTARPVGAASKRPGRVRETFRSPDGDGGLLLPDLLTRRAREQPDSPALVVAEAGTLSFGAWDRRANGVARALIERGLPSSSRVGLVFDERDWMDLAVAWCGVMRA